MEIHIVFEKYNYQKIESQYIKIYKHYSRLQLRRQLMSYKKPISQKPAILKSFNLPTYASLSAHNNFNLG